MTLAEQFRLGSSPSAATQHHRRFHQSFRQDDVDVCVVFVDLTECYWLKWLKSGFRHCFVGVRNGDAWLVCDSLKNHMELFLLNLPADFDLPAFYADQGHIVLVGKKTMQEPANHLSAEFLTCVAVVKRILALRTSWIWTPWQLFQFLIGQAAGSVSWRQIRPNSKKEANFQLDI